MAVVYYELIVKGDQDYLCAYLQGYMNAKKISQGVICSKDCPLQTHNLREMIKYHGEVLHLVCRAGLLATVKDAITAAEPQKKFEIKRERKISRAFFTFEFETVSRAVGAEIKDILANLPAGLNLRLFKPEEKINPEAKGAELYAPAHDYKYSGTGELSGDIEKLIALHIELVEHDFVKAEEIVLRY
jgi:hypothetical protein